MERPRRSGFLGSHLARCSRRSWQPSRFPLLPSGRHDELWARLKGHRVADSVIEAAIEAYAQRRQTVSEHQLLLQGYLGLRPCGPAERDLLGHFLREEALRLESTPALIAQIVLPAGSTLRRVVGEQREQARHLVYTRLLGRTHSSSTVALRILGRRWFLVKPIVNARHTDRLKKVKIQVNG